MIPLLLTDGPAAAKTHLPREPEHGKAEGDLLFGDVMGLIADADPQKAIADPVVGDLTLGLDGAVAAEPDPNAVAADIKAAPSLAEEAGPLASAAAVESARTPTEKAAAERAPNHQSRSDKAPKDTGQATRPSPDPQVLTLSKPVIVLPTVAQSIVEGRLPQAMIQSASAEIDEKTKFPFAGGVPTERTVGQADAPASRPAIASVPQDPPGRRVDKSGPVAAGHANLDAQDPIDDAVPPRSEAKVQPLPITPAANASVQQVAQPPAITAAQTAAKISPELTEKGAQIIEAEPSLGLSTSERVTAVATATSAMGVPANAETARHVSTQIAVAVTKGDGATTQISLNPEELGRVRLSMSATDGSITLNILAERPETNDLLRRHIEVLAQEFRSLGYNSISFSFGTSGQGGADGSAEASGDNQTIENDAHIDHEVRPQARQTSGLDLRM